MARLTQPPYGRPPISPPEKPRDMQSQVRFEREQEWRTEFWRQAALLLTDIRKHIEPKESK